MNTEDTDKRFDNYNMIRDRIIFYRSFIGVHRW
jgi:hypothetical protein